MEEDYINIMRHGFSMFNQLNTSGVPFEKHSRKVFDMPLHEKGVEQIKNIAKSLAHIKYAFVSPMRRALQTARIALSHAKPIKVFAHPLLLETLKNGNGIPSDIEVIMKEFPEFDFSLVLAIKPPYYLQQLDPWLRDALEEKYRNGADLIDSILLMQKKMKPLESYANTQRRINKVVKEEIPQFIKEHKATANEMLVITHSAMIACLKSAPLKDKETPTEKSIHTGELIKYPIKL